MRLIIVLRALVVGVVTFAIAGCGSSKKSMTSEQVTALVVRQQPAISTNSLFATSFSNGCWYVFVIRKVDTVGAPTRLVRDQTPVAAVRDSDGKIEMITKP